MADGGFRGTTQDQDSRFADKQKKLMKSIKFPASYSTKVDIKKVNLDVIKPWITKKVVELLGIEDEVLINYIFAMLEENKTLDPKQLQINLTDFLAKQTPAFVTELWDLMISAQSNVAGIPQSFLDAKMAEVKKA
ncbi:PWI domain-containing protein, partial [Chytriomyces cf. hyalinus JEL632]